MERLDVLGCSILSLKLGCDVVLDDLDWLNLSICCFKFTPQVSANPRSADLQLALRHELLLEVTELQRSICCLKQLTMVHVLVGAASRIDDDELVLCIHGMDQVDLAFVFF